MTNEIRRDPILLVDDDPEVLKVYKKIFTLKGFNVIAVSNGAEALEVIRKKQVAVVITDIIMPNMNGMEPLTEVKELNKFTEVIMFTAEGSVHGAVEAVHKGAYTYFEKPVDVDELVFSVQKAYDIYVTRMENQVLKQQLAEGMMPLIGADIKIEDVREKIKTVAALDSIVLLTGESGAGKEIVANHLHYLSSRAGKPFVKVNCAALSESLLESELFGHEKGSFTGADRMARGRFEMANGGTLLLDEIGELSLSTQAKLLRVLEEKEFERVGGSYTIKADFRLITSTNRDLKREVEEGRFRKDLYYRINVFPIHLPSLRERRDDISALTEYFIDMYCTEMNKKKPRVSKETLRLIMDYEWPGNVRELRNVVERLIVVNRGESIETTDLPEEIVNDARSFAAEEDIEKRDASLQEARHEFEREYLIRQLAKNNGNITKTAKDVNLARKNLYKKLKEYEIDVR